MFHPGDVIGFSGRCFTSDLVNIATWGIPRWGLSHVGIVSKYENKLFLFESTTLNDEPCEITSKKIDGVQAHEIFNKIRGYDGRVWHYPLTKKLDGEQREILSDFLMSLIGTGYDKLGAFRAGGVGFSFIEGLLHKESLHSIFCSELVAAAHREVGILSCDNAGHFNPNHLVRWELYKEILAGHLRLK